MLCFVCSFYLLLLDFISFRFSCVSSWVAVSFVRQIYVFTVFSSVFHSATMVKSEIVINIMKERTQISPLSATHFFQTEIAHNFSAYNTNVILVGPFRVSPSHCQCAFPLYTTSRLSYIALHCCCWLFWMSFLISKFFLFVDSRCVLFLFISKQ